MPDNAVPVVRIWQSQSANSCPTHCPIANIVAGKWSPLRGQKHCTITYQLTSPTIYRREKEDMAAVNGK